MIKLILNTVIFILLIPNSEAASNSFFSTTPDNTIIQFYDSISIKNCENAVLIRPSYTLNRCRSIDSIKLRSLHEIFKKGNKSVFFIDISYNKNGIDGSFSGYLWLKRSAKKWTIQNDYISKSNISSQEYIKKYIGVFSDKKREGELLSNDNLNLSNHNLVLRKLRNQYKQYSGFPKILIDISEQKMYHYNVSNQLLKVYPISTATKGAGNIQGSDKTPLGAHIIKEKYGNNAKIGTIFKARKNTGKISEIFKSPVNIESDAVTTRILWLDGLENNKNKGGNVDSHSRFIYIHGTPEEGLIGQPASHGCIRMYNTDVVNIFSRVPSNTVVYIGR